MCDYNSTSEALRFEKLTKLSSRSRSRWRLWERMNAWRNFRKSQFCHDPSTSSLHSLFGMQNDSHIIFVHLDNLLLYRALLIYLKHRGSVERRESTLGRISFGFSMLLAVVGRPQSVHGIKKLPLVSHLCILVIWSLIFHLTQR